MTTLAPACTPLPWDSDFFGVQIGRGSLPVSAADECARKQGLDCLYLLVPIDEIGEAHEAVRLGFRLVDVRVEFEIDVRPGWGASTRPAREDDLPRLAEIARASFRRTRFYNDPRFDDGDCDQLYETWTANAYAGDTVLVAGVGQIDGYVTLTESGGIGLIAVAAEARRQGIGRSLMSGAHGWAWDRNLPSLTVVTQGGNTAAQRLFQACGGRTKSVGLWLHRWYS